MVQKISDAEDKYLNSYPTVQSECIKKLKKRKWSWMTRGENYQLMSNQCTQKEEGINGNNQR